MSKYEFQTEVSDLLNLMINSLYSNKEIFLRELVSNASDALDKLNYLCITDDNFKSLNYQPNIKITADKENKTLTIADNGIGMSKEDLINNLGTIAKSGTKSFVEALSGDAKKDSSLIGQFGVGFYAAFMVADKLEVTSKKAGTEEAHTWTSSAGSEFTIDEATKEEQGTSIVLHMKEDDVEFLEEFRLKQIIEKYSNHIPFAINFEKEEEGETKTEQINKASALWRLSKSEIKEQEYKDFYKTISHDSEDPLLYTHTKAEGTLEYNTLFYIPKTAPMDLYRVDYQSGIKLYVKRVFISDDDKELLPTYLRFIKGIVDVEDLPLNVSREILQQNVVLSKVKKASVKKILSELKKLKTKDAEAYLSFYKTFGRVLKEGIMSEFDNKDLLLELLMFKTSKSDALIDLQTYHDNMQEGQKEIFYLTGEDTNMLKNSPLLEGYKAKGIEVLILDEEVDSIIVPNIGTYKELPLSAINHADMDEDKEALKESEETFKELTIKIKEFLKDDVKDVKVTNRLQSSPSCLVYDKNDPDFAMQQMLKQMGQMDMPEVKPILEINPEHAIFTKLNAKKDFNQLADISSLLLDLAKLNEGMKIEDAHSFSTKINKLIENSI